MPRKNITSWPVFALGFRPMFLLASLAGAILIGLWMILWNSTELHLPYMNPALWHAHEMVFGFAAAVVAGFLLTAIQNWTGIPGVHGIRLVILTTAWLCARILAFIPYALPFTAVASVGFLLLLFFYLLPYFMASNQRRNIVVAVIALVLVAGDVLFFLEVLGITSDSARRGIYLGLNGLVAAIVLIGGRVIPFFTRNGIAGARIFRATWLEILAHATVVAVAVCDVVDPASPWTSKLSLVAFAVHLMRWLGWQSWQARRLPILWVLHLGYAWVVIGYLLKGLMLFWPLMPGIAIHAFTVGGIGVVVYAMMSRVALGHTGRQIVAERLIVLGYLLLNLAALVRVGLPAMNAQTLPAAVHASGTLWVLAFAIFFWRYFPILTRPRVDGLPG